MSSPVEQIKERLNIVDVVSSYIKLEKAGAANYKAKCPFHGEKTPSFFVSPSRQTFHCFGCNAGGDMFTFVENIEGLDFTGALKVLADRAGITLEKIDPKVRTERDGLFRLTNATASFFEKNLERSKEAKEYLKDRGINEKTIKEFRIGFAKNEWRSLFDEFTQKKSDSRRTIERALEKVGLIKASDKGYYDRFRGRVMFPISDSSGRIAGFSGRILPAYEDDAKETAKYLNSPETALFDKSRILYGFDKAKLAIRKAGMCVLVEGQMDLVMSHQGGVRYAVAVSGTALSLDHLRLIKRLSDKIVFAFDADDAGVLAARRGVDLALSEGFDVRAAAIPEGLDPADLIKKDPKKWENLIKESVHIIDFLLYAILKRKNDAKTSAKEVSSVILPYVAHIANSMEQAHFVRKIAENLNIKEDAVWGELDKIGAGAAQNSLPAQEHSGDVPVDTLRDKIKDKILSILIWQESIKKPAIKCADFRKQFEKIITEDEISSIASMSDEKKKELLFEAEVYYENTKSLDSEIRELLVNLEKETLKEEFEKAMDVLKEAESKGDENTAASILEKCHNISKKLGEIINK